MLIGYLTEGLGYHMEQDTYVKKTQSIRALL